MDVLGCTTALHGYKMGKSLKYKYMISLSFFKQFILLRYIIKNSRALMDNSRFGT